MSRKEWVWVLAVTGLVLVASTIPYLVGYLAQDDALRFSGALLDRSDYHSYLARMWQGYRGAVRFRLPFTPESCEGIYSQPFYLALGHLARLTGLSLPFTYQVARVVFALLMMLAIYRFIARFITPLQTRRVSFLLATTVSGLGWLTEVIAPTPPGGVSPMDFWLLDGFTYLAMLTSPHFCAAITLLLSVFVLLLRRPQGPSWREGALALLASLALGFIHPYTLLLADLLPALYWAVQGLRTRRVAWRGLAAVAAMGMAQLPLLAYDLWVFYTNPVFAGWSAQNVTLSPPPRIYLLGYGLLLALGVIGLAWGHRGGRELSFPLLWVGLVMVLIYLPWNLQRRFLEGVQVPLGLLAGVGLVWLTNRWLKSDRGKWRALTAAVALMMMSNLYLTAGLTLAAASRSPALFWPADLLAGVDWLGAHSSWEDTVLAGPETGNLIPARVGQRVVVGHGMETVNYEGKRAAVARFFSAAAPDAERRALVRKWGVVWVFYGPEERSLGNFDPHTVSWLEPDYRSGEVSVYRVSLEGEP